MLSCDDRSDETCCSADVVAASRDDFLAAFGAAPEWEASAPGRVNLIGEHVDYLDGFVLPMAIERRTTLSARRVPGAGATLISRGMPPAQFDWGAAAAGPGEPRWANYVRGTAAGFLRRGIELPGLEIAVCSTVPIGAGLSSSAALEVATAALLNELTGAAIPTQELALLCQRAEHEYAGVPCGIMDQFASAFGRAGHVLLIDCRTRQVTPIASAAGDASVLVIDTRVKHDLATNEYAARRRESEEAARRLGVAALRDLLGTDWRPRVEALDEPLRRRARHAVSEMERVTAFVDCFRRADWPGAGRIMCSGHASLRDDYEVSCAELDFTADAAAKLPGVYGCRMTGGGFGGCCVALVDAARIAAVSAALTDAYRQRFGREPTIFHTRPADGPRVRRCD